MMNKPSLFAKRVGVLATMHQKEKVIAPLLEEELGIQVVVPPNFNTDAFGTFTREIKRPGDQLEAARLKAEKALAVTGETLVFASEGTFGPHPGFPYIPCNKEIVILLDKENGLEVVGQEFSTETNYSHKIVATVEQAYQFAKEVGFPEHGLVVIFDRKKGVSSLPFQGESSKKLASFQAPTDDCPANPKSKIQNPKSGDHSSGDDSKIIKGITPEKQLFKAVEFALNKSANGKVHIETDMRALYNPTRMKNIEKATLDLIRKLNQLCPNCSWPGFEVVARKKGLPCGFCNLPTKLTLSLIYQCRKCDFIQEVLFPDNLEKADPAQCIYCNP